MGSTFHKFLAGFILFAGGFIVGGLAMGFRFIVFFGTFLFFPSIIALAIDFVRLNTKWHIGLKILSYIGIFFLGLFALVASILTLEALEII